MPLLLLFGCESDLTGEIGTRASISSAGGGVVVVNIPYKTPSTDEEIHGIAADYCSKFGKYAVQMSLTQPNYFRGGGLFGTAGTGGESFSGSGIFACSTSQTDPSPPIAGQTTEPTPAPPAASQRVTIGSIAKQSPVGYGPVYLGMTVQEFDALGLAPIGWTDARGTPQGVESDFFTDLSGTNNEGKLEVIEHPSIRYGATGGTIVHIVVVNDTIIISTANCEALMNSVAELIAAKHGQFDGPPRNDPVTNQYSATKKIGERLLTLAGTFAWGHCIISTDYKIPLIKNPY